MANVVAATIFTVCDWDWRDFAIDEAQALPLAEWLGSDQDDDDDEEEGEEETDMSVRVFDSAGNEQTWQWAVDRYGVRLEEASPPEGATVYRLTELRQKIGPCGLVVHVQDEDGNPLEGIAVLQGWVDGSNLPDNAAPRMSETWWMQPDGKPNRGNGGFTNSNGDLGWGWGGGEQFDPDVKEGAHWYWVMPGDDRWYTDVPLGFGWLLGTDHDHLDITFTRTVSEGGGDDDDDGGGEVVIDLEAVIAQLERIAGALEGLEASVGSLAARWPFA